MADASNPNNDDIVDTIAQYDLDEDFPEYANEQNRELNQIVSTHSPETTDHDFFGKSCPT